jgi:hypothetical protein
MRARTILTLALVSTLVACGSAPDRAAQAESTIETPPLDLPSIDVPTTPRRALESPTPQAAPPLRAAPYEPAPEAPPPKLLSTELDDLQLPDVASAPPTDKEWLAAKRMRTTSSDCTARIVREWMTILCSLGVNVGPREPLGVVRVISGDATDVGTWSWIETKGPEKIPAEAFVAAVFPVRRGDRRLLELTFRQFGAKPTFNAVLAFTISELWLEGMTSPEISVTA